MNIKPGSAYNKLKVKFAKGGKVPPGDNATPTFNDSLAIYNNTQELKKFYSPEKGYEMVDNYTVNPSDYKYWFKRDNESIIKSIRDLAKEEANVENAKSNAQLYPNTYKSPTDFLQAITKSLYNTKFNNPYQVQVQDRVSGEINWKAPLNISDSRIIPDKIASYYSYSDPGVITDIYEYDPLKVKPYSMLTEAEKKARLEKYGTDGFPASYKNSNATSNTSSTSAPVVKPRPDLSLDKLPIKSAELTYNSEIPIQKVPEARVDSMSNLERYIPYTANYGNPNLPQGYWDKGMGKKETQYANGGKLPGDDKTKTYTNKAEYDKALQAYNDSLNIYNERTKSAYDLLKKEPDTVFERKLSTRDKNLRYSNPLYNYIIDYYGGIKYLSGNYNTPESVLEKSDKIHPVAYQEVRFSSDADRNKSYFPIYKKPTQKVEYKEPTMVKGKMESEPKPITELMMPDGTKWSKEKFVGKYGEPQWMKATGQKFAFGGKMKYAVGGTFDTMNKDGTYGVQEKPEANTSWTAGVSMAGNMIQGTQDFSKSPNASMYKTEDAVWDTVGQLGPQGALIGGITDMMNTALRPIRESNDKKAGTSGYNEGLTIAGGLLNPLAALQTRGKYEGGYTDITGEGYEKYMAGLNRRAKFRENIGDFDANMNANINQISYLNSSPTFAKGGKIYANGGQMTTEYKGTGTHETMPYGGIPVGGNLVEPGEVRFDYLENKQPKSYIFSNRIKYKK